MEDPILNRWHLAFLDRSHHFVQFAGFPVPIGEIKLPTSGNYVESDEPGAGRNIAVPGPLGLIAMALKTMLLYKRTRLLAAPLGFRNDRWICPVVTEWDQLNEKEKPDCPADQNQSKSCFVHTLSF